MNKFIIVAALSFCWSQEALAQDTPKNVVKFYPLLKENLVGYERALSPRTSFELQIGYVKGINLKSNPDHGIFSLTNYPARGFTSKLGYKMYGGKKAPFGFFHGPQLTYRNMTIDVWKWANDSTSEKLTVPTSLNVGILSYMFGGQVRLLKIISLSAYTGLGMKIQYSPTIYRGEPVLREMVLARPANDKLYISPVSHFGLGFGITF